LEILHGENSPYKILKKEEFDALENAVKTFKGECSSNNPYYKFVKYVDEPEEMKRINDATKKFIEEFSVEKIS
jgi:hypothetical protein